MTKINPEVYRDEMEGIYKEKQHIPMCFDNMSSLESNGHEFIVGTKSCRKNGETDRYSEPHDISSTDIMVMRLKDGELCGAPLFISAESNTEYWWERVTDDQYRTIEAQNSVDVKMGERFLSDASFEKFNYAQSYEGFVDMSNPAMVTAMMKGGAEGSKAEIALNLCRMFIRTSESEKEAALTERRRWQTDLAVDKLHKKQEVSRERNNRPKLTIGETENMPNNFVTRVRDIFR